MNLNPVGWASSSLRLVARLFNSNVNSAVPVTAISEAPVGVANADIALVAKGTGATLAQVPDGTAAGGNKRGDYATDWQKVRNTAAQVSSGLRAVILGGSQNTASGTGSFVGAGLGNTASSLYSFVGAGSSNNASGTYSVVVGGDSNTASGSRATVVGGQSNTTSGSFYSTVGGGISNIASNYASIVGGGDSNTASGNTATVAGGQTNTASGAYSFIGGGRYGTTRAITANHVFSACSVPIAATLGATQSALLLLARETTNATATVLASDSSAASTTNQVILPNNSAYSFSGEVIAGVTGAGDTARWTINGAIKRGANAASTAMVGTATVTMTHFDVGAAAWTVAVTADTTNGGIAVTVTGAASTTIRWVCKINTTEMTF